MISPRRRRRVATAPQNLFFSQALAARPPAAPDTAPPDTNDNVLEETPLERISRGARARRSTLQQMAFERYGVVPERRFDFDEGGTVPFDYDPFNRF